MILDYFTTNEDGTVLVRHVDIPDDLMSKEYVDGMLAKYKDPQEAYQAIQEERLAAMVDVPPDTKTTK